MSYVHTALNELMFPAMPAINIATIDVTPTPIKPGVKYLHISSGMTES